MTSVSSCNLCTDTKTANRHRLTQGELLELCGATRANYPYVFDSGNDAYLGHDNIHLVLSLITHSCPISNSIHAQNTTIECPGEEGVEKVSSSGFAEGVRK